MALEFAIFNNGVPSSVFYGMHPEHEIVQHIPDEAIEELFPPSAEDVSLCRLCFIYRIVVASDLTHVLQHTSISITITGSRTGSRGRIRRNHGMALLPR